MRSGGVRIAAAVIACAALLAAAETARFTSKKAQEAQKKYEGALERLRAEHEAKVQKVRAEYAKSLKSALKDAEKAKDGPEADRIRNVTKSLEEELARAARPKAAARKIGDYTFSGGSGTSIEDAIVIGGAEDSVGAVDAQAVWIRANHPGFKKTKQGLLSENGKHYDEITLEGPDGKKKVLYFDITSCFGFPGLDE